MALLTLPTSYIRLTGKNNDKYHKKLVINVNGK